MEEAKDQITDLLRVRRQVPFGDKDNFGMATSESILERFARSRLVGLAIAWSSYRLSVDGRRHSVMNIMLVLGYRTHARVG